MRLGGHLTKGSMFLAPIRACECMRPVPVMWQRATRIAWSSSVTQATCDRELEKQAGIFVSKLLFLEHVGICLAQTGACSAEREHIQCLGGMLPLEAMPCVCELSALHLAGTTAMGFQCALRDGASRAWGMALALSGLQFPDSSSRKGMEHRDCREGVHGTPWLLSSCLVRPPYFLPISPSCPGCVGRTY